MNYQRNIRPTKCILAAIGWQCDNCNKFHKIRAAYCIETAYRICCFFYTDRHGSKRSAVQIKMQFFQTVTCFSTTNKHNIIYLDAIHYKSRLMHAFDFILNKKNK